MRNEPRITRGDIQMHDERLNWDPGWWTDPVPFFLRDHITVEIAVELNQIQLATQTKILEVQQNAIKQQMEVLGKIRG